MLVLEHDQVQLHTGVHPHIRGAPRPRLRPSQPTSGQSTAKAGPWRPLRAGASVATAAPLTHVSQALASAAAAEGRGHQVVHLDYLVDQALRRKGV